MTIADFFNKKKVQEAIKNSANSTKQQAEPKEETNEDPFTSAFMANTTSFN